MKRPPKINIKETRRNSAKILALLKKHYPDAKCALIFRTPLEILVATILSAQCTDVRVNKVTPALFRKYKNCGDYVRVPSNELEKDIRSTGFFHNKAKSIHGACRVMIEQFDGKVPKTMEEIVTLPGVARKTANVVLLNAYGVVNGIAVDTHVRRIAQRLGLTSETTPEKIEQDLMKIFPKKRWPTISYLLIDHGRKICKAPKPACSDCFLNKICPSAFAYDEKGKWIGLK